MAPQAAPKEAAPWQSQLPLGLIIAICIVIEVVLSAADLNWGGLGGLRNEVYRDGAFWPAYLAGQKPIFPAQPWTMFLSYGFLHGGLLHLSLNMITLYSLGNAVIEYSSTPRFLLIYFASMIGGGLAYGYLAATTMPMVGASGALFGLGGAIVTWRWLAQGGFFRAARVVGPMVLMLLLINVALYYLLGGLLAWETHLGGFLVGCVIAPFFRKRRPK